MHIVLIETSGNQNYIFATNKLRENVGASELTFQAGTKYVLEAVGDAGGPELPPDTLDSLLDKNAEPAADALSPYLVEIILAVSGKALLLVRDEATGRKIVRLVTLRALKEAPGLDVRGVVGSAFDPENDAVHKRIAEVHRLLEQVAVPRSGAGRAFPAPSRRRRVRHERAARRAVRRFAFRQGRARPALATVDCQTGRHPGRFAADSQTGPAVPPAPLDDGAGGPWLRLARGRPLPTATAWVRYSSHSTSTPAAATATTSTNCVASPWRSTAARNRRSARH